MTSFKCFVYYGCLNVLFKFCLIFLCFVNVLFCVCFGLADYFTSLIFCGFICFCWLICFILYDRWCTLRYFTCWVYVAVVGFDFGCINFGILVLYVCYFSVLGSCLFCFWLMFYCYWLFFALKNCFGWLILFDGLFADCLIRCCELMVYFYVVLILLVLDWDFTVIWV